MKRTLKTTLMSGALALILSSPLMAAEVASVAEARQEVARNVASLVNEPGFEPALRDQLDKHNTAMLSDVLREYGSDKARPHAQKALDDIHDLEREAIRMRGLDKALDDLFDIRVHGIAQGQPLPSIRNWWTGTIVKDKATHTEHLVAYDPSGMEHRFPLESAPNVPMLLVESENSQVTRAGMQVMNEVMRKGKAPAARGNEHRESEELTVLSDIWLKEDMEPNTWKGAAEVFVVISGVNAKGEPLIETKQLPWLDYDKTWYTPQRMDLITWRDFGGSNYVNIEFWEEDGELNYRDLAQTIIETAALTLTAFGGPKGAVAATVGKPVVKALANVVFDVLNATSGKPDYIDSFYTFERGKTYGTRAAPLESAGGNVKMVLQPYTVEGSKVSMNQQGKNR